MQRRKFILATLAATPLMALALPATKNARSKEGLYIPNGQSRFHETIKFRGVHPTDTKISGQDTDGEMSLFEYIGLGKTGPALHVHFNQDETFFVTEGRYRFVVGDKTFEAQPGDTVFLPRNVPHTWIQLTDKGKLLFMLQPAGKMEEFFRTMNGLTKPPTPEEIEQIHEAHGMKVVGPPLNL